jgi:hypothetical protein
MRYIIPVSPYMGNPLDNCSSSTLCLSPSSHTVALLESKDVLGHFFPERSNIQSCADTYVYDNIRSERQNVDIFYDHK